MTTWDDDEELLRALGDALAAGDVPDRFVTAGKAAFAWHNVDAELAELTHDSALTGAGTGDPGTRAAGAAPRAIAFRTAGLMVELELSDDAVRGQLVPAAPGRVELRSGTGPAVTVAADEVGWFVFRPMPAGPFRLRCQTADGAILTDWIAP